MRADPASRMIPRRSLRDMPFKYSPRRVGVGETSRWECVGACRSGASGDAAHRAWDRRHGLTSGEEICNYTSFVRGRRAGGM